MSAILRVAHNRANKGSKMNLSLMGTQEVRDDEACRHCHWLMSGEKKSVWQIWGSDKCMSGAESRQTCRPYVPRGKILSLEYAFIKRVFY